MTDQEREKLNAKLIERVLYYAAGYRKGGNVSRQLSETYAAQASADFEELNRCKRELYALGWRVPYPGDL